MGVKLRLLASLALVAGLFVIAFGASAQNVPPYDPHQYEFETDAFFEVWERTDRPVQEGETERTWMWGPGANTPLIQEPYLQAPDGERDVQYSDKSRMEMPWAEDADPDSPWFITQGLLAYELMSGRVQVGEADFVDAFPAQIQIAGDPDAQGPTYATLGTHLDSPPRTGESVIIDFMHSSGDVEQLQHLEGYGVTDVDGDWQGTEGIDQPIASVFWEFMTSSGPVYENGILQTGQVVESPFYAVGYPLTPAVWTWVKVNNVEQNVLIQCFERRCLTYAPDNPDGWEVESGNVGQHYFEWRYTQVGDLGPIPSDDDDDAVEDDDAVDDGVSDDDDVADDGMSDDDTTDDEDVTPEATSFSVSPEAGTGVVDETHEITVTVEDQDEEPFQGASVAASVTDGPHQGTSLTGATTLTDEDGEVTLSYTGSQAGIDTITVTVAGITDTETVVQVWSEPEPEIDISIEPVDQINPYLDDESLAAAYASIITQLDLDSVGSYGETLAFLEDTIDDLDLETIEQGLVDLGTIPGDDIDAIMDALEAAGLNQHTFEVTVTEGGDPAEGNVDVVLVHDPDDDEAVTIFEDELALDNGTATLPYSAVGVGVDTITASFGDEDASTTKTWVALEEFEYEQEASLLLLAHGDDQSETNDVGETHRVEATVYDQYVQVMEDPVSVTFDIDGEHDLDTLGEFGIVNNPGSGDASYDTGESTGTTNQNGVIGFAYEGETEGEDQILAFLSDNPVVGDQVTKTWVEPESELLSLSSYAGSATDGWNSSESAVGDDLSTAASIPTGNGRVSPILQLSDFDFETLPGNAEIQGIQLTIWRSAAEANVVGYDLIRLFTDGEQGTDLAPWGHDWGTTQSSDTFGGESQLLGLDPDASDINDEGFGVEIAVVGTEINVDARVYAVEITVFYTVN